MNDQTSSAAQTWHNPNASPDQDAMRRSDPNSNPSVAQHQALETANSKKSSGKDIGQVDAPIVSLNPTSGQQSLVDKPDKDKKNYEIFDHANQRLNHTGISNSLGSNSVVTDFAYPFVDLEAGQGFFIPVEKGMTTDKLMADVHDKINAYREQTAECEKDKNGDDVWESVVIQTKKRTDDGVIQLDGLGKPIVGANQTNRPKLIYAANFIARPVVKGDNMLNQSKGKRERKAESDGVLVIRVL